MLTAWRRADTVCDFQSQTAHLHSALANCAHTQARVQRTHTHTLSHTRMLVCRSFLFVQHRVLPPWLPSVEISKSWCGRQKEQYAGRGGHCRVRSRVMLMWCGCTLPVLVKGTSLRLWRWGSPGATRSFIFGWLLVGEGIPSGSCPSFTMRILGNWACAAVTDSATALLQFGSWDKWKELIAKRGCDCLRRSKLALAVHKWRMRAFVASKISRLPDRGFGKITSGELGSPPQPPPLFFVFVFCLLLFLLFCTHTELPLSND